MIFNNYSFNFVLAYKRTIGRDYLKVKCFLPFCLLKSTDLLNFVINFSSQTFFFWFLSLLQTLWLQTVVINRYKKYYSLCSRLWMNEKDIATQINILFDKRQTFFYCLCNSIQVLGLKWFEKLQILGGCQ